MFVSVRMSLLVMAAHALMDSILPSFPIGHRKVTLFFSNMQQ